ncbi:MAG: hypothetical protein M1822_000532 [Bathelium mastoideum]|nr:MAG: hypothetical protein M1822_000532 [Bathelium mastoideum]
MSSRKISQTLSICTDRIALTNPELVKSFVASTAFEATNVKRINLGSTNFTYRLFLAKPYGPKEQKTAILKYAAAYLAGEPDVPFSPNRQTYECRALERIPWDIFAVEIGRIQSPSFRIPQLYLEDPEHAVCIMQDVATPPSSVAGWEEETHSARVFFEGTMDLEKKYVISRQIGTVLGLFLGKLHHWGTDIDHSLATRLFKDNDSARTVTIRTTFRDLVPGLKNSKYPLGDVQRGEILHLMQRMEDEVHSHLDTLTMGDFWPGNIVLNFTHNSTELVCVNVIDWEFATMAPAFTDVGHFIGEVFMNNYFEATDDVYINLIEAFLTTYKTCFTVNDTSNILSYAAAHIGCFAPKRVGSLRSKADPQSCISCLKQAMNLMNIPSIRCTRSAVTTFEELIRSMRQQRNGDFA